MGERIRKIEDFYYKLAYKPFKREYSREGDLVTIKRLGGVPGVDLRPGEEKLITGGRIWADEEGNHYLEFVDR